MARGLRAQRGEAERSSHGFTLIEMMAVAIILVLIATLAFPNFGLLRSQAAMDDAQELAAVLEFARQRAVGSAAPHQVRIDVDAGAYWIEREERAAPGPDESAPAAPVRWSELQELPLRAPAAEARAFAPLPDEFGRPTVLREGVRIEGVETPAGVVEQGEVVVPFLADGSSEATDVLLADADGRHILLSVAPLADVVAIQRVD